MYLRKAQAGSSSTGHTWTEDGQIVEVPDEVGAELLKIPHGGFSDAGGPDPFVDPDDEDDELEGDELTDPEKVTEPDPAAANAVTEPAPPAATPVAEKPAKAAPKKASPKGV